MDYDDDREYNAALKRIEETPALEPHRATIMYDWGEGGEHWEWVATQPVEKIISWAASIEQDEQDDAAEYEILFEESEMEVWASHSGCACSQNYH